MAEEIILTAEGREKLESELAKLKNVDLKDVAEQIKSARELGDLSENADYHQARERQGFVAGRIAEIEYTLSHSRLAEKNGDSGIVAIGSQVVLKSSEGDENYEIVGATEADPLAGKISVSSPIAKAIFGHKVGDKVPVETPSGEVEFEIKKIG
ncbi:MAG: transcription elongation factor GreA [Candidatus Berkelbacteria bacterium Athens1014_28]|uniref:Transcription elongation factor GreA n=1 Tax=Candidatus Berkelbacteria bacterium Athens1014_28 TaxID=2017145 RepID=A0A554LQQ8_9BACT|nr:MAG: transcription elongation factor GreA [Candidatus Berkelbacteria bacterium Athens1014_28]